MRTTISWRIAAPLCAAVALASACSDDDPGPPGDDGGKASGGAGTGGKATGGTSGTGGRASGGTPPESGGSPSSGGRTASGGARDASVDAPGEAGEPDAHWPECPTTGVDGGGPDAGDAGASPYPACAAPPSVGAHEVNVFPAGLYELEVHALYSNTGAVVGLDPTCSFERGTAKVRINVVAHRPCCGEACLRDPSTEIVVTLSSNEVPVAKSAGVSEWLSVGRTGATGSDAFEIAWDEARNTHRVTVDRATGGIVARGISMVRGGGGSDGVTSWESVGSLACPAAPAHSAPPAFPNGIPLTNRPCSAAPLTPPQDWDKSCTWRNRSSPPASTCSSTPPTCPPGETLQSCTDLSNVSFDYVCCPQ